MYKRQTLDDLLNNPGDNLTYQDYVMPVSYTHLDVYKRQVHRGLCRELFTLRERTEKRKYSWQYETSIYFFGKN